MHRPATQGTPQGLTSFPSARRPCPTVFVTFVRVLELQLQSIALAQRLEPQSIVWLVEHMLQSFVQVDQGSWPTLIIGWQQQCEQTWPWEHKWEWAWQ